MLPLALFSPHIFSRLPSATASILSAKSFSRAMATLWAEDTHAVINLGKGHPNPRLLPLQAVNDAYSNASVAPDAAVTLLQYGRMQGNPDLCASIARWTAESCDNRPNLPSADDIVITTGSGPALSLIMQLFTNPGDTILVDSPGYFLAYYSFEDCRVKPIPVPTDAHGLDVDRVEALLKEGVRPSMVYTVPIANNPTAADMSEERKEKLVQLAREYKFKIAADEVYQFLKFGTSKVPKSLFEYDDPSDPVVFSINSFSKLLGPGMRLGWLTAHKPFISRILDCGALHSGGGFNPLTSAVVLQLFNNGFMDEHIALLRREYGASCVALCKAVEEHLVPALKPDEKLQYHTPRGGFFCFITLPERYDADKLLVQCKENGVSFFVGKHFSPAKDSFKSSVRLCFAWLEIDALVEGVRRLGKTVKEFS